MYIPEFDINPFGGFFFQTAESSEEETSQQQKKKGDKKKGEKSDEKSEEDSEEDSDNEDEGGEPGEGEEGDSENQDSDGDDDDAEEETEALGTRGKQVEDRSKKVDLRIREVVERLASGVSQKLKKGTKYINVLGFVKNTLKYNYTIPRQEPKPKYVYIFMDTSGSVSSLSNMIISVITSCTSSKMIRVISGSEAYAEYDEQNPHSRNAVPWFKVRKPTGTFHSTIEAFIEYERPALGSTFIFWGDIEMGEESIKPDRLKQILFPYKPIWLCTYNSTDSRLNPPFPCYSKMASVMPIKNGINSVERFINQLKNI